MGYFKLRMGSILVVLVCGLSSITGVAQGTPRVDKLTEVNGDFQKINGLQQDEVGNLWVASDTHIEKFNPFGSTYFNNFKGLPENTGDINTIFIDSKFQIWAGTENGLLKFNKEKEVFEAILSERPFTTAAINRIVEGEDGALWMGAKNGIWNYQGNKIALISFFPSAQAVNELLYVNNNIIFGTSRGLFSLNKDSNQYRKINLPDKKDLNIQSLLFTGDYYLIGTHKDGLFRTFPDFNSLEKIYSLPFTSQNLPITGMTMDKPGNFYVATRGDGLLVLDKNLKLVSQFIEQENSLFSLSNNYLNGIFLDSFNTLWVSTDTGQINSLNFKENIFEFIRHDPKKYSSLADNFTTAIEMDNNGNIWFGNRQGLSIWNPQNNTWQHIKNLSFSKQSNIPDVVKDLAADGVHMWVATFNDGVYKVNINTFLRAHYSTDSKVKTGLQMGASLLVDSDKTVWAGGEDGDLIQIKPDGNIKSFPLKGINSMLQLSSGDILAAGKNGVFRLNKNKYDITPLSKLNPNAENLPYFTVNAISETQDGEIVLATEGAGILIYTPGKENYQVINKSNGLPSNRIQGLIINGKDDIWAGTSKGLVNFTLNKNPNIRIYNKNDGLLSEVFTRGSFARIDDKLAFGTFKGVSLFNPETLQNSIQPTPGVVFGKVEVISKNDKLQQLGSLGMGEIHELDHDQRSFRFTFYGLTPGANMPLQYSWKLEGYDEDWSPPGVHSEVSYANLPPGNYSFQVKAGTSNGIWSPAKEMAFQISAPWWFSPAAYIGYAMVMFMLLAIPLILIRRRYKAKLKAEHNLRQEIAAPLKDLMASFDKFAEDQIGENKEKGTRLVNRLKELVAPFIQTPISSGNDLNRLPKITPVVIEEYFQNLVKDVEPILQPKHIDIVVNNQWNRDQFFYDVNYLHKIFNTIISCSVKYQVENGKIIINLIPTNKGDLKVQITDNGRGLPPEEQKVLRKYFSQSRPLAVIKSGDSTGLKLVKDLIDLQGGSMAFESSKDEGVTYTLILKNHSRAQVAVKPAIKKTEKEELEKEVPVVQGASTATPAAQYKILIAQDNDELRKVFVNSFRKLGEVQQARNGREAFEMAVNQKPDVVVADFDMPEMDGLSLIKALKDQAALAAIPVYLMISERDDLQIPTQLSPGNLNIIKKPVNIEHLLQLIVQKLQNQASVPFTNSNLSKRNSQILRGTREENFLSKLEKFIVENIGVSSLSIEELSAATGVTPGTLLTKLKTQAGKSPQEFILVTRLNYSKTLITNGNHDLNEVAKLSGFENKDTFYSAYKKHFGFMPGTIIER